jgi:hypothetical protein
MKNPCEEHFDVKADGYCPICLIKENELLREGFISLAKMMKTKEFPVEAGKLILSITGKVTK